MQGNSQPIPQKEQVSFSYNQYWLQIKTRLLMSSDHLHIDASFFFLLVNDLIIYLNLKYDFVSQQTISKLREKNMYA